MPWRLPWAALLAALVSLIASAEPLEAVLARLDKAAAEFRDLTAEFSRTNYTAVLNETTQESGRLWIRRAGPRNRLMRLEFDGPNPRSLGFDGAQGQIFYPKIQTVQIYDLGKHRSLVDQFLLLGFGTAGREMARSYNIKMAGETTVAERKSTRLQLAPKSAEVAQHVLSVELAIPEGAGYPVQQRFSLPGGDWARVVYSAIRWNPNLPEAQFRLNLPKGVKREYPQK
jgi:outer membrane lipoprotein-sorting protein